MSRVQAAAGDLVGRDEELGAVAGFLDAVDELPGAIVLRGEAGIGKTALWLAGVDAAAARGYRIFSSRPSEAETGYSFAGLADLLGEAVGDVLSELPPIQQRALEAALLLGETDARADDRAVAAAFLAALRLLAARGPLCVAVDDAQWLDAASVAAITFAVGRLDHEPVGALLAVRGDAPDIDPFHHARTLLALGRTQRRAKSRGAARATLEDALARFEGLDAPLWAEQTRAELRRIGGRAPSRGELTEGERRVAALVAEGRTNKEVAASLFLAERTVASHLTRVYAKLGVRSRSELTLRLTRGVDEPGAGRRDV